MRKTTAFALCVLLHISRGMAAGFNAPPPGPAQIEADWLRQEAVRWGPASGSSTVQTSEDAAGGVDGIINGQFGFHTALEDNPWWQVDLGATGKVGRVVVYNRNQFAERAAQLRVLVSLDGERFTEVYRHSGPVFGKEKSQPLILEPESPPLARFVRLQIPGKNYFHLDEVEVWPSGNSTNIARGRPAKQSSVSEWSVAASGTRRTAGVSYGIMPAIERGMKLTAALERRGVAVGESVRILKALRREASDLGAEAPEAARRELFFKAHRTIRGLALSNPLLDFDSVLFVKRAPTMFPHMSDQHYGWWSRGGGGIYVLERFKSSQPSVRCLTGSLPPGNFVGPDLSYDGRRLLFAYARFYPELHQEKNKANKENVPEDAFYHIYEVGVDGSGFRQVTRGKYDDFDPRWLPNGDIAFLSTRKGVGLQVTATHAQATLNENLPDSYVRCGGDNYRPVPVFTLHGMSAEGGHMRPLSAFENFEWSPSVAADGRLLYTRWDYIDRFNGHFFSLWSSAQDGSNPQLVYGNYTVKPQVVLEARAVPGSSKMVFTACAHHSITGGTLCLLDREQGTEFDRPITRLTPEVVFPETEGAPDHYYANPWPLSEEFYLAGWADAKLPPHRMVTDASNPTNAMGIYLYDAFGNLELLYRDPEISSMYPMPLASRSRPIVHAPVAEWQGRQEGEFLVQDARRGLEPVRGRKVAALRIIGVPPKVQPHQNSPMLGVSAEDPGKYILGTVPVESDGSAYFRIPSGIPVFFQALDEQGVAVQTMRSLTFVMPGQTLACVGCHEHRDTAPSQRAAVLAAGRTVSPLKPAPSGSWPLRFDQLVQPVLDARCVECHGPGGKDAKAAALDLTAPHAWNTLISFRDGDLKKVSFERDLSIPGQGVADISKLWAHLARGHQDIRLSAEERERLLTWLDTYAHRVGHYSEQQEKALLDLREAFAHLRRQSP